MSVLPRQYCIGYSMSVLPRQYCIGYSMSVLPRQYCIGYSMSVLPRQYCIGYSMSVLPRQYCIGYSMSVLSYREHTTFGPLKLEFHRGNRAASGRNTSLLQHQVFRSDAARCVRFSRWNSSFRLCIGSTFEVTVSCPACYEGLVSRTGIQVKCL